MLYEKLEKENEILKAKVQELTDSCREKSDAVKKLEQENRVLDEANKILVLENMQYKAYMHLTKKEK